MAFGLAGGLMSPVFTALLSSWSYETINLVLGCVALIVGLTASTLIIVLFFLKPQKLNN